LFFNKKQNVFYESDCERYEIQKLLFKNKISEFFLVKNKGEYLFLQIASNKKFNDNLKLAKIVLDRLRDDAEIYEAHHYEKYGSGYLRYEYLFPKLQTSFIDKKHGNRLVNILSLNCPTDSVESMVSVSDIINDDNCSIDSIESTWILEKILRLLVYAHCYHVSLSLNSESIFINQNHRHIILLDWANITVYRTKIPIDVRKSNISDAALLVLDLNEMESNNGSNVYFDFIRNMQKFPTSNSVKAYFNFRRIKREFLKQN